MNAKTLDLTSKQQWILAGIVIAGFLLRLNVVLGSTYHWDEEREWIPFTDSISFEPGAVHLPIRTISHPVLPVYLMKLGSVIAGENPLGFRLMSLLAGSLTVLIVALVGLRWGGFWTAFWASSLLAFNEYHIFISSLAIDKPIQIFFVALAVAGFVRFLESENSKALYFAGAMTGLAFLCKETTALLLPGFLIALLLSERHRRWLLRPAPYLAVLTFVVVISPDLIVNFFLADELEYSYADHLGRAAGFGFTRHHFLFFLRGAIAMVYDWRGEHLSDLAPEYASMNPLIGSLMLGVASWMPVRLLSSPAARRDGVALYLPIAFWVIFGTFLFTRVSTQGALQHLTYVAWFWSDLTLIPGSLMAGAFLASLHGKWRAVGSVAASAAVLYAIGGAVFTRVGTPHGPVVAMSPEYILPPDGRLVTEKAAFNYCMICEKGMTPQLVDVQLRLPDGSMHPALGTDNARIAPDSADGTELILRARDAAPNPDEQWQESMWYEVTYELTDKSGRQHVVQDVVMSPLHPSEFSPRFWSVEGREERKTESFRDDKHR